jgi:hypothetical protein
VVRRTFVMEGLDVVTGAAAVDCLLVNAGRKGLRYSDFGGTVVHLISV